eukprot:m.43830 g.43830  ORF g.43830 m.43830 type:complete len:412 (-) comp12962_c0_seq1:62-1297(-)
MDPKNESQSGAEELQQPPDPPAVATPPSMPAMAAPASNPTGQLTPEQYMQVMMQNLQIGSDLFDGSSDEDDLTDEEVEDASTSQLVDLQTSSPEPDLAELLEDTDVLEDDEEAQALHQQLKALQQETATMATELEERQAKVPALTENFKEVALKYKRATKGVDLVLVMDCTDSMDMQRVLQTAAAKLTDIATEIKRQHPGAYLQAGFVGYRDYGDDDRFEISPLSPLNDQGLRVLTEFIGAVEPDGGDDIPEDIAGGLQEALTLLKASSSTTKLLVLVTDAPGHGQQYHDLGDDRFPKGKGRALEDLAKEMAAGHVEFRFLRVNDSTDKMTSIMEEAYNAAKTDTSFVVMPFDAARPEKLVPAVIDSVAQAFSASEKRREQRKVKDEGATGLAKVFADMVNNEDDLFDDFS